MAALGHRPVLLEESLDALAIRPDGVYLDAPLAGVGMRALSWPGSAPGDAF